MINIGVLVACWLKCWPAIERLQVQTPKLFSPMSILSSTLKNEEVFITASFGGDVKPLVPGSWLILATCAIRISFLVKPHLVKSLVAKKKTEA